MLCCFGSTHGRNIHVFWPDTHHLQVWIIVHFSPLLFLDFLPCPTIKQQTTNRLLFDWQTDFSLGNQITKYFINSMQFKTPKRPWGCHAKFSKYLTAGASHSPKLGKRTEISKQKAVLDTQREIPPRHRLLNPYPQKHLNPSVWSVFPAKIFLLKLCL